MHYDEEYTRYPRPYSFCLARPAASPSLLTYPAWRGERTIYTHACLYRIENYKDFPLIGWVLSLHEEKLISISPLTAGGRGSNVPFD